MAQSKSVGVVSFELGAGDFGFPGAGIEAFDAPDPKTIGAASIATAMLVIDLSGSMANVVPGVKKMVQAVVDSCQGNDEVAANTVFRAVTFSGNQGVVELTEGFQKILDVGAITKSMRAGGSTPLNIATMHAVEAVGAYAKHLKEEEYTSNGVIYIISDGGDTDGGVSTAEIAKAITAIKKSKYMMAFHVIVIGIDTSADNDTDSAADLSRFCSAVGTRFIDAGRATPENIKAIGDAISSSVTEASQSASVGSPSKGVFDL